MSGSCSGHYSLWLHTVGKPSVSVVPSHTVFQSRVSFTVLQLVEASVICLTVKKSLILDLLISFYCVTGFFCEISWSLVIILSPCAFMSFYCMEHFDWHKMKSYVYSKFSKFASKKSHPLPEISKKQHHAKKFLGE